MEKHYGQIVEYRIRKNGYSISNLAKALQINRRSIYNWFNQRNLKKETIFQIGTVLQYDFSEEFPELFTSADFNISNQPLGRFASTQQNINENEIYKDKYVALLEEYNQLLTNSNQITD